MKAKFFASAIFFLSFMGLYLGDKANAAFTPNHRSAHNQMHQDGEIIGILITANKNEIKAAHLALKKSSNPEVRHYAEMITHDHSDNLKKVIKLSKKQDKSLDSAKSIALKHDGKKEFKHLSSLNGREFDKAYIHGMIADHKMVISTMDNDLLKNVSNPELKNLLLATRPHLIAHLDHAEKIQKSLK